MINKPYQKVFNDNTKGFQGIRNKAKEFASNPLEKLRTIGKNIADTFHPTEGVYALTNDEFVAKYSNYKSIATVRKMLDAVEAEKGDKTKVFNKILDSLISEQAKGVAEIERHHEERYLKLLGNINDNLVFEKGEEKVWICRNCGHVYVGEKALEVCPICKHPQSYMELKSENY